MQALLGMVGRLMVAQVSGGCPDLANQVTRLTPLPDPELIARHGQVLRGVAFAPRREHQARLWS
jgi:hypothetical protein